MSATTAVRQSKDADIPFKFKLGFERFANFEKNVFIPQTNKKGASVWTDAPFCFSTSSYD